MTALQGATRWTVQNSVSCARFSVRNLGLNRVTGTVPLTTAFVDVDASGCPLRVEATLDLAGIDTGNSKRDRDLAKKNLLDTARFPTLTFRGGPGVADGENWIVPGRLAAHGSEIEVTLRVTREGDRVTATTSFDRTDLGIRAPRVMIGRRIDVRIDAVLATDRA